MTSLMAYKKIMKNERGVTLIILIVTIVVMLIIASVTVKFATDAANTGLLDRYKNSTNSSKQGIANQTTKINEITKYQENEWGM